MFDQILAPGTLLQLSVFVVPGFIAWKVHQSRQPQGEYRATNALVEIVVYGVLNAVIWSFWRPPQYWTAWPSQPSTVAMFVAETILSPFLLAWGFSYLASVAADRGFILSPHPRAWDWVFNRLAQRTAYAMIVTLRDGRRVAGVYKKPGFASLYPYPRDIFLGEIWTLDDAGRFEKMIFGAKGIYVDKADILTIELFEYNEAISGAVDRETAKPTEEADAQQR